MVEGGTRCGRVRVHVRHVPATVERNIKCAINKWGGIVADMSYYQ